MFWFLCKKLFKYCIQYTGYQVCSNIVRIIRYQKYVLTNYFLISKYKIVHNKVLYTHCKSQQTNLEGSRMPSCPNKYNIHSKCLYSVLILLHLFTYLQFKGTETLVMWCCGCGSRTCRGCFIGSIYTVISSITLFVAINACSILATEWEFWTSGKKCFDNAKWNSKPKRNSF